MNQVAYNNREATTQILSGVNSSKFLIPNSEQSRYTGGNHQGITFGVHSQGMNSTDRLTLNQSVQDDDLLKSFMEFKSICQTLTD